MMIAQEKSGVNGAMIVELCSRVISSTILRDRLATITTDLILPVACRRQRAVTCQGWRPADPIARRLVLDGHEHGGRFAVVGEPSLSGSPRQCSRGTRHEPGAQRSSDALVFAGSQPAPPPTASIARYPERVGGIMPLSSYELHAPSSWTRPVWLAKGRRSDYQM